MRQGEMQAPVAGQGITGIKSAQGLSEVPEPVLEPAGIFGVWGRAPGVAPGPRQARRRRPPACPAGNGKGRA